MKSLKSRIRSSVITFSAYSVWLKIFLILKQLLFLTAHNWEEAEEYSFIHFSSGLPQIQLFFSYCLYRSQLLLFHFPCQQKDKYLCSFRINVWLLYNLALDLYSALISVLPPLVSMFYAFFVVFVFCFLFCCALSVSFFTTHCSLSYLWFLCHRFTCHWPQVSLDKDGWDAPSLHTQYI